MEIEMDKRCEWREDEDGNWGTGCDNIFVFIDGGPPENGFYFCPYCGEKLCVVRFVPHNL